MENFIKFIDEDVDGCGTDVSVIANVIGPVITNDTVQRIKDAINAYKSENEGEWDTDGCLDAAKEQFEAEGYKVIFIIPSVEICS